MANLETEVESIEKAIERDLLAAFKSRSVTNPGSTTLNPQDLTGVANEYNRRELHADLEADMQERMRKYADKR